MKYTARALAAAFARARDCSLAGDLADARAGTARGYVLPVSRTSESEVQAARRECPQPEHRHRCDHPRTRRLRRRKPWSWRDANGAYPSCKTTRLQGCESLSLHRHHGRILGIAQRQRRLHVAHVARGREFFDKGLKRFQVGGDALEHEINFARQHPALPHQGLRAHELLESDEICLRLAREMHHCEHGDLVAELLLIEQRTVSFDVSGLFKRAHAAQARWRRNADPTSQLHIGDAAVRLQLAENLSVYRVETGRHRIYLWRIGNENIHTAKDYFAKEYYADGLSGR